MCPSCPFHCPRYWATRITISGILGIHKSWILVVKSKVEWVRQVGSSPNWTGIVLGPLLTKTAAPPEWDLSHNTLYCTHTLCYAAGTIRQIALCSSPGESGSIEWRKINATRAIIPHLTRTAWSHTWKDTTHCREWLYWTTLAVRLSSGRKWQKEPAVDEGLYTGESRKYQESRYQACRSPDNSKYWEFRYLSSFSCWRNSTCCRNSTV